MKKAYLILLILILFAFLSGCGSSKKQAKLESIHDEIAFMANDLYQMSNRCKDAYDNEDFEEMAGVLDDMYEKCKEMSYAAERIASTLEDITDPYK